MRLICILLPPPIKRLPPHLLEGFGPLLLMDKVSILKAIFENIYPGMFPETDKSFLEISECYFDSDVWFIVSALGREHNSPIREYNGVLYTWTDYRFFQQICTQRSGASCLRQGLRIA